ncbi:chemotaxis response regulator protein-glutamate methylesterase [Kaistia dalseonensis]|uniref:Protein-glutamate methylesterase/protein-glutamine glutaminase n=1 Tax=Kaistia dalseonensis TaxID=410840 RepID=A0ABU0H1E1_9HYPH|nr:chemotaxis response regulator protein-glutamate methylesterase [Kaistia dalseonensis]MCX5493295.1 chemotaxis response regulator protein-glutamate methylesterase [Kaistia dalseonensis]MDQ0435852.1 two-component system response regulator WspF [Kaistia dalseonensis]
MRIGIVNDLPIAVEVLRRALGSVPEHQVAWIASNGREAVSACRRDLPDLVLMDITMPEMDGVEATRRIMAETPCPILLVTASIDANVPGVYEAMGFGALDAVDMPSAGPGGAASIQSGPLLAKIAMIGKLSKDSPMAPRIRPTARPARAAAGSLIAIGASAGGPAAVAALLATIPADFPAAFVLVQHVDPQFVPGLTTWLGAHSGLSIRSAEEGDHLEPGTVFVAATADHLVLKSTSELGYTAEPRDYVYRPSIDVFFESAARWWPGDVTGVLLTGMGRDGAKGLKTLRDKGHLTIAQDKGTSAVYGMPKAAAAIGAAVEILPLPSIAPRLIELSERSH